MSDRIKTFRGKVKGLALDDLELKKVNDEYHFEGFANKPVIDRYNEIVDVAAFEGTLETYARNPIMLLQHDPRQPIGSFPKLELTPEGLWVGGVVGNGWDAADAARKQVEQKVLRAMSIGFRETKRGVIDKNGIYHIVALELLEISLVSIPANQEAVFTYDPDAGKFLSIETFDPEDVSEERVDALARKRGFVQVPEALTQATDEQLLEVLSQRSGAFEPTAVLQLADLLSRNKGVVSYVKYPTQDAGAKWDAGAARASLRQFAEDGDAINFAKYRAGFTYVIDGQEDKLGGYKLPHHYADGGIKTNLRGCRAVIGVLAGARGGVNIPDAAKRGVYDHVARHITTDFDATVPSFEDLGKMDEAALLKALDVTEEELDSVKAEFDTVEVSLDVTVDEKTTSETPGSESVVIDFSQFDEAIALWVRESQIAATIESLQTQLTEMQAKLEAVPSVTEDRVKTLEDQLEAAWRYIKNHRTTINDHRASITNILRMLAMNTNISTSPK